MEITRVHLDQSATILRLTFSKPANQEKVYKFWPSTNKRVLVPPLLKDPYESKYVFADKSGMSDYAGDGLFLKRDVPANKTISFYNGIRVRPTEEAPFHNTGYQIFVDWNKKSVS